MAAFPQAAATNSKSASMLPRKWTGNIRLDSLVNKQNACCKANAMRRIMETVNSAIVWPLRHAYTAPPKLTAMTRLMIAPPDNTAPMMSNFLLCPSFAVCCPAFGLYEGNRKKYTGAKTPAMTVLSISSIAQTLETVSSLKLM